MVFGIPFFRPAPIEIAGPVKIQIFGLLVAIGVLLGGWLVRRWGDKHGLNDDHTRGMLGWTMICGFIGAHVFDVLAYQHEKLMEDPLLLFKIWAGISSYGGIIGGFLGFLYYVRRHGLSAAAYADAGIWGFVPGFTFGRLGCTVVHDHIGARASEDFFLATYYSADAIQRYRFDLPEPGFYHNLGFYEFLYMLFLCLLLVGLSRWKSRPVGLLSPAIGAAYAPVRFGLDFLRVNREMDPRYLGLTFAQWVSIITVIGCIYIIARLVRGQKEGGLPEASTGQTSQTGKRGKSK